MTGTDRPVVETKHRSNTVRIAKQQRSVLTHFDAVSVSGQSKAESRRREAHLPVISLYRWWARRTSAVASALTDAATEVLGRNELVVADPFAGGGVMALAALLRGHTVLAQELDPWAARNLATMATPGDTDDLTRLEALLDEAMRELDAPYITTLADGTCARMSYTLRVAVATCPSENCGIDLRLYPAALVSRTIRIDSKTAPKRPVAWFACPAGHLHAHRSVIHSCPYCSRKVHPNARYTEHRLVTCWSCRNTHSIAELLASGVCWDPVLVQRTADASFEISEPTLDERDKAASAPSPRRTLASIPPGCDTTVLLQSGYSDFADLYPDRQLATLTAMLDVVNRADGVSAWARDIARSCVIGAAEFAGLATRWDARYLKPYETVASHHYNIPTLSAEIDLWGERGRGTVRRRLRAASRAAKWLGERDVPALVHTRSSRGPLAALRSGLTVVTGSSTTIPVPDGSVDLILTDPPYHDDVQYADLASLFRAWDGRAVGRLAGDVTAIRNGGDAEFDRFEAALTNVFSECRRIIAPSGHLVLSFANREPRAWAALLSALDAAGWYAAGFEVVHSENELDHAKAGRRACSLDVILDLVPESILPSERHRPARVSSTDEESYCFKIGDTILRVGNLRGGWRAEFIKGIRACTFQAIAPLPAA